jgi:hypothetical protein
MLHVHFALATAGIAVALFLAMLLFLELGRRLALRQVRKFGTGARVGVGVVDGTVYGLFGLLMGFTFSTAATRLEGRRSLIAEEVNAISTAWQRIDVLPAEPQGAIRRGFRAYLDALLVQAQEAPSTVAEALREPAAVTRTRNDLWLRAVAVCLAPGGEPARMLLLPAMNEMFDAVDRERMARRMHPPIVIFVMLCVTALATALFGGYGLASGPRNWIYIVGIAATTAVTAYVILELEFPRIGWVRVDTVELVELRHEMK